ncbi:MAG: helix-turn-helix domain-containing protein, partial [Solirubrobacteraceae bacterium]
MHAQPTIPVAFPQLAAAGLAARRRTPSPTTLSGSGDLLAAFWLPPTVLSRGATGVEIAAQREQRGWSQAELARRARVPRATVQR